MQSEAIPILSSSSRKDEANAVFPVSIRLQVCILEGILSSYMARANGTCHVLLREHLDNDTTTFISFACVERRRSGPDHISRSAAMT